MSPSAEIGTMPAFNLMRFNTGGRGRFCWSALANKTDINSNQIKVEPTSRRKTVEISYSGSKPSLDPLTVEEMWRLLRDGGNRDR